MSVINSMKDAGKSLSRSNERKLRAARAQIDKLFASLGLASAQIAQTQESAEALEAAPSATWHGEPYLDSYGGVRLSEANTFHDIYALLDEFLEGEFLGATAWIRDMYVDTVVFNLSYPNRDKSYLFQAEYSIDEEDNVNLGEPVEVRSRTVYEPLEPLEEIVIEAQGSEAQAGTVEIISDCVPIREAAVADDGTVHLKLIGAGWNSSKTMYYPKEVLARDVPNVFPAGTKMFFNHPTRAEEAARPEGEIEKVAALLKSTPIYMESGPSGAGVYAQAQVLKEHRETIDQLAPHIGPSIFCKGRVTIGEADGHRGKIANELLPSPPRTSVDFVTEPGAHGEIVQLFEAARKGVEADSAKPITTPIQEGIVTEEEKQKLQDENARLKEANVELKKTLDGLETAVGRLSEAQTVGAAERLAAPIINATKLPMRTQERLLESVTKSPVLLEDGALDSEKFAESVQAAADEEVAYAREAYGFGSGGVRGFGGAGVAPSQSVPSDKDSNGNGGAGGAETSLDDRLAESFKARGMSADSAKIAAGGRA